MSVHDLPIDTVRRVWYTAKNDCSPIGGRHGSVSLRFSFVGVTELLKINDTIKQFNYAACASLQRRTTKCVSYFHKPTPGSSEIRYKSSSIFASVKEGLYRIQILCRRHPFWSYLDFYFAKPISSEKEKSNNKLILV